MCTLFVARVAQISNDLHWSVAGRTKISTEVDMWRWNDSLNFLRAGYFGRTPPLSVSAFPQVASSMAFERRNDRADCVRDTVNRCSTATLKTVFCCAFGCRKYDEHRNDGVSFHRIIITRNEEFRRRLLGGCSSNRCPKLRKCVEKYKQWWMNDPSTGQRSAIGEKQKISTHLLLGETLRGRLVMKKDREIQMQSTSNVVVRFFLREHISPRTSSTVVRVQVVDQWLWGTHVGGHARTRYRVGHGLHCACQWKRRWTLKNRLEWLSQSFATGTELDCEIEEYLNCLSTKKRPFVAELSMSCERSLHDRVSFKRFFFVG